MQSEEEAKKPNHHDPRHSPKILRRPPPPPNNNNIVATKKSNTNNNNDAGVTDPPDNKLQVNLLNTTDNARNILQTGGEIPIMSITPTEAPFLVGMKGRNISLIRKCSGMVITIKNEMVFMTKQRSSGYKPDLAVCMVLSACSGGILRWFVTQKATNTGYPFEKIYTFEMIAQAHSCTLKLLRARCGHMCLMLIPDMPIDNLLPTPHNLTMFRDHLTAARNELLEALVPPQPPASAD